MRILAVTNLYPNPFQPNRATFNRQQFCAVARTCPMAVISPVAWTDEVSARLHGGQKMPKGRRIECDGITVDHPCYVFPPKLGRAWYGQMFRRSIRRAFDRALVEFRPDVVLASWAFPDGWAAVDLAKRAGLPVVLKVHGSDILTMMNSSPARRTRTLEALHRADGVVAVSRDLADKVIEEGVKPERVRLIYNGVDTDVFKPGPMAQARERLGLAKERPTLVYIGNLVPVKGVDVLIEACGLLAKGGTDFATYMIGQGSLRPGLERRVAELGIDKQVKFVGPKPHRELPDWFRAADVFVLPSRSEGVPNVLLEASACGTRFVASRVGGIPEITHLGSGLLVKPKDPAALAEGIRTSLADASNGSKSSGVQPGKFRSHADAAGELIAFLAEASGRAVKGSPQAA